MEVAWLIFGCVIIAGISIYWSDAMPFVDSFTTVSSIIAMIPSVKMYFEQC